MEARSPGKKSAQPKRDERCPPPDSPVCASPQFERAPVAPDILSAAELELTFASMSPSLHRRSLRASIFLCALGFYACQDKDTVCELNETQSCLGHDGCSGTQTCNSFQSGWEVCVCSDGSETSSAETGDGGDTNASTSGDSGNAGDRGNDGTGTSTESGDSTSGGEGGAGTTSGGDSDGGEGGRSGGSGGSGANDETDTAAVFTGSGIAVVDEGNDYGINGAFYVRQDSYDDGILRTDDLTHTEVTPVEFGKGDDKPCINGTVARVPDGHYSAVWGTLIGLELNQGEGFDAAAQKIQGFSFDLSGSIGDADLRFEVKVKNSGAHFCSMLEHEDSQTGHFEIKFDDLVQDCFSYEGNASFDPSQIEAIEWIAMADADSSHPVDQFCVEKIEIL